MLSYPIDFFLFIENLPSDSLEMSREMKNIYLPPYAQVGALKNIIFSFKMPSLVNQTVVPVSHLVCVHRLKQVPS